MVREVQPANEVQCRSHEQSSLASTTPSLPRYIEERHRAFAYTTLWERFDRGCDWASGNRSSTRQQAKNSTVERDISLLLQSSIFLSTATLNNLVPIQWSIAHGSSRGLFERGIEFLLSTEGRGRTAASAVSM